MKKLRSAVVGLALMLVWVPTTSLAAEEFSATVGVREWFTTGYNEWNFSGAGINVLSDLRWRGVDAFVTELYGELFWWRIGLLGSIGLADIEKGVLIDDDFALSNRRGRFSHTRSSVDDGDLVRVTVDFAGRLFTWDKPLLVGTASPEAAKGYLDALIGYQFWEEEYVAFGATGILDLTPFGIPIVTDNVASRNLKVLTHEYRWHTLRLGLRTSIPLVGALSLKSHVIGSPYVDYRLEDVHHLRTDLRQDPSFSSESTDGWGIELDAALSYLVWKGLAVEAGYRYSRIDSGEGDKFTHALTGTTKDKLNNTTFERYGPHLAVSYRW